MGGRISVIRSLLLETVQVAPVPFAIGRAVGTRCCAAEAHPVVRFAIEPNGKKSYVEALTIQGENPNHGDDNVAGVSRL